MSRSSIPVDLRNPGQVFACLGFMEASEALLGEAQCVFDWQHGARPLFHLEAKGDTSPVAAVLEFLAQAEVFSLAPLDYDNATAKWKVPTLTVGTGGSESVEDLFPYRAPRKDSPATLPGVLKAPSGSRLVVDHWGDTTHRDAVKFWAGSGGYPGAALLRDALDLVREDLASAESDPFSLSAAQSSAFRLDWRRDYVPIDVGFSPNVHSSVVMLGFPVVEILAVIGLTHARPLRVERLRYRYSVLGSGDQDVELLPSSLHRAALGGCAFPFPQRFFEMHLGWPGKEGQARCILEVIEEISP